MSQVCFHCGNDAAGEIVRDKRVFYVCRKCLSEDMVEEIDAKKEPKQREE